MVLFMVLGIFLLAGCNKSQVRGQKKPNKVHNDFLCSMRNILEKMNKVLVTCTLFLTEKKKRKLPVK